MKVLFVQESDWLDRGPHQQHQLGDRLSLRGHEIMVIDFEIGWRSKKKRGLVSRRQVFENVHKINDAAKVTVVRPGIVKVPLLDYASLLLTHRREIARQIKEFSPDVIVGYGILNASLGLTAARRNDIPFVYYWIDVLHRLIPLRLVQPLGKLIETRVLKSADRVLVINRSLKEYVVNAGALPERTGIVCAGFDVERFRPSGQESDIRKQYGLDKEDTVLFFMGWLYHFSGLKEVARQLARTADHGLKLLIVGEGDAYDELKRIREMDGLQDRIILTGKKPYEDIPGFIGAADVCLLPAYRDEIIMQDIVPIKMYEYMAMKKPVIATALPGVMKEFGENSGVVYVDKPEDVVDKAASLARERRLQELGAKARSFVEKYSWDNITDEFERILKEVVRDRRASRVAG